MYRILIADDEQSIREGLGHFLEKRCPDYQVVGLASDGMEALELSKYSFPDVIITDINMPRLDGLEYLERMKEILPDTVFLVITGYEKFEYALQCIRLGVREYFLKPVDTGKLCFVLEQIKQELDGAEASWESRRASKADTIISGLVMDGILPQGPLEGVFCPVVGRGDITSADKAADWLQARLQSIARVTLVSDSPEAVFVLQINGNEREGTFLQISQAFTAVHNRLIRETDCKLYFFIGKFVEEPLQLRKAYLEVKDCAYFYLLNHAVPAVGCEEILVRRQEDINAPPAIIITQLLSAVTCGNLKEVKACCKKLEEWFLAQEGAGALYIRLIYLDASIRCMQEGLSEKTGISYMELERYRARILECESVQELSSLYIKNTARFIERKDCQNREKSISSRIDTIIEENIGEPGFSLADVAGRLFLSPNYLRAVFKKETGMTFVEYLTWVRMERAKMLFMSGNRKVQDVAEQVGYLDSRYFSVSFKRQYQMSPMEYQNQCKEEERCQRIDAD